jgi:hypothetical protein
VLFRSKANGTPHILTNSWGIFQESWDPTYANNPSHPFTKKVLEAIAEGIIVLFAAGNCGGTCPDGRCGSDNGPGRSIWGANSHPAVITVGAVNKNEEFVGYSSQGPGALDANKPDFCSVTHFSGYHPSDSGTSAATPILAGAVALLKQAVPSATQNGLKSALKSTAKDIGPGGFDQHSGAGIVRIKAAHDKLKPKVVFSTVAPCKPSVVAPCIPSRMVACKPSVLIPCKPSVVIPCMPSHVIICKPSVAIPCPSAPIACPSFMAACIIPSMAIAMCTPPEPITPPGQAWGEADPAWSGWYGWGEEGEQEVEDGEEHWYGGWE